MYNRSNERVNYYKYLQRSAYQSSFSPCFFAYGRTALKAGLQTLNLPSSKKILIPNYICAEAILPFQELGLKIIYHSVKNDLSPDWDSINKQMSQEVVGIIMVHYCGIPQDINTYQQFCKEHNLLLIEDNSHGYGGQYNNVLLGKNGDIGIASPRKSFPILNGGILFIKYKNQHSLNDLPLEPASIPKLIAKDFIGRILDSFVSAKELVLKNNLNLLNNHKNIKDYSIDKASYEILIKHDLIKVCNIRSEIYAVWEKWCKANSLTPIFDLKVKTYAPLSLPVIFKSKEDRDHWMNLLKKNHIAAYLWPELPASVKNKLNTGQDLHNRTLFLPIHLSMKANELEDWLFNKFTFLS
jgi:perosamine synthetase